MTTSSALNDYKLFLRKNFKIILGSMIALIAAMLLAVTYFITRPEQQTVPDEDYIQEEIFPRLEVANDMEKLSSSEEELLTDYLNKESYSFRIYVENDDGSVFTDNFLLRQILVADPLVQEIQEETTVEFSLPAEVVVTVFQISGSEMLQIKVGTGNGELNQQVINYYYNYIENGNLSLFNDKSVYIIDETPFSFEDVYGTSEIVEHQEMTFLQNLKANIEIFLIVTILGVLAGIILGLFVAMIKERFSREIPSIYNFNLYGDRTLVNLDAIPLNQVSNVDTLVVQSILGNRKKNKLVLSEEPLASELIKKLEQGSFTSNSELQIYSKNFEEADLNPVEEIVVLIQVFETSKEWFEKQMELVKTTNVPVKIIRLPLRSELFSKSAR